MRGNFLYSSKLFSLSKKTAAVFCIALFSLVLALPSHAQTPSIGVGTWSLDKLSLVEIKADNTKEQIAPGDIDIAKDIFDSITFKSANKCVLAIQQIEKDATYIYSENTLAIHFNNQDFLYQYSLSGNELTLVREFEAGNVSGEWVKFKLTMLFSIAS